jgi:hypothetical protein
MRPTRRLMTGLAVWAGVVGAGIAVTLALSAGGDRAFPHAPPLYGVVEPVLGPRGLAALAVAGLVVLFGPRLAARARWPALLVGSILGAGAWAAALAWVRGTEAFTSPLVHPTEFLASLPLFEAPGPLLRSFTERLGDYTVHVQGHPPGVPLLLWALDRIGLARPGPLAVLVVAAGASSVPAALIAARELADESLARVSAPFLVLAPSALWIATSMDALYLGLGAWCVALVALATGRHGVRSVVLAAGAGVIGAAGLYASYGLAPIGLIVLVVAVVRRRIAPLLVGGGAAAAVGLAFAVAGFSWIEGLRATVDRYEAGIAAMRPYGAFLLVNLAALAVATGPVAAAALAVVRDRGAWLLCGPALVAIVIVNVAGLSRGEVERIWLFFTPWVLVATGGTKRGWARPLLALAAVFALVVGMVVHTKW